MVFSKNSTVLCGTTRHVPYTATVQGINSVDEQMFGTPWRIGGGWETSHGIGMLNAIVAVDM